MNFETLFNISDDPYYYTVLIVDFVILFALLVLVRSFFGRTTGGVNTAQELSEKDNYAFGISLAGAIFALSLVFAGVATGDVASSLEIEAMFILGYGVLGIIFLISTRVIFDKVTFPKTDLRKLITEGNSASGILDAGNMIATSTIIFGVFAWVKDDWLTSVVMVIVMFFVTQLLLVLASRYRVAIFQKRNNGQNFCDAISSGNNALAIRFAGFQIGAALAISSAGTLVNFSQSGLPVVLGWGAAAIILLLAIILLTTLIEKVVLHGVPVSREVDVEKNYGVAAVEAACYAGIGLLITTLLS